MTTEPQPQSEVELVRGVLLHISNMAKGEIALAKAELGEKLQSTRSGVVMVVIVLALLPILIGLIFTTLVLALIALGIKPVWVALGVTCVLALAMLALGLKARKLLRWGSLSASRTMQGLRRDVQTLKEMVTHDVPV